MSSDRFIVSDGIVRIEQRGRCYSESSCDPTETIPQDAVEVVMPGTVKEIGRSAFAGCSSLNSLYVPASVGIIEERDALEGCSSLAEIKVSSKNPKFRDIDGVLFKGTKLHLYPPGKESRTYNVPDFATEIGDFAFDGCSVPESIHLPDSVTRIGWFSFRNCSSLVSINIPDSVKIIYVGAFYGCSSLKTIRIPKNIEDIGTRAFQGCSSLEKVYVPKHFDLYKPNFLECPQVEFISY